MFLYPALLAGFAFVAVPLLVHLINMLRHKRRRWAAMDFLLLSYRKRQKWLRLRQFLLLLSRIAVALLLVSLLCGWTGGRQLLGVLGGQTTHHIVILDDSYSMGDQSSGAGAQSAYGRALESLDQLVRRLANDESIHQLTVMRASRAALASRGGSESGDVAADLSAQTVTSDAGLIARVMSTTASPIRTDLVPALDLAGGLVATSTADENRLYILSDFRERDWAATDRIAESLRLFSDENMEVRMIDCASRPQDNLAITELAPVQDVWVAGVPVVVRATIKNYGQTAAKNVSLNCRVIRYGDSISGVDPTLRVSGVIEPQPAVVIESLAPGAEITKSFQVFINETGTHAIEVELPADALEIDNRRWCTLPLSDVERVLIVDSDPDESGAYTLAAVLNPGSQVRIGAVPDIRPPGFLRGATRETLASYRAIYLIDLPEITDSVANALYEYVDAGGGLAWFLGDSVNATSYNASAGRADRRLLPRQLDQVVDLPPGGGANSGDIVFGDRDTLMDALRGAGDSTLAMVGLAKSWTLAEESLANDERTDEASGSGEPRSNTYRNVLMRRDTEPLVTEHTVGAGTVVTVLSDLDQDWTNWSGDPTFVPFLLLANARLWSGAAAETSRSVVQSMQKSFSTVDYFPEIKLLLPVESPPRVTIETEAVSAEGLSVAEVSLNPIDWLIEGAANVDDLLQPGVSELGLLKVDGGGAVIPLVTVIENGEGDLRRAESAEIQRALLPMDVRFVTSEDWSQSTQRAGSSTVGLMLLALLGLMLAAEQALAYWASYHTTSAPAVAEASGARKSSFGLAASGGRAG